MGTKPVQAVALAVALAALPTAARGQDEASSGLKLSFRGTLESDLRFDIERYRGLDRQGYDFSVNRNDLTLHADVSPLESVVGVVDSRLRYYGFNSATELAQTSDRNAIDPFSVQLDQAYVAVRAFSSVDIKVGRMIQNWGAADEFNPTDNLNARDFYDPMDYTRKVPNQMLEVDFYPSDWLTLNAVFVPVFKPSMLPPSTSLAYAVERDSRGCVASIPPAPLSHAQAEQLSTLFGSIDPCSLDFADPQVRMVLPPNRLSDAQGALRAQLKLGDLALALSWYYGRFTFPVAYTAVADATPNASGRVDVSYTAEVMFPRMQVAGLDFSYSAPWLFDVGIVGEVAVIFPEKVIFGLRATEAGATLIDVGNLNVPTTPFVKATLGLDYTFTRWLYVNAMYVRGFFDEFNDMYGIHNYVVASADVKTHEDSVVWRLSGVLNTDDLSSVSNPQVTWVVVPGVEMLLGAFVYGGHTRPKDPLDYASRYKFGQKAAGRSIAYLKARLTW